MDKTTTSGSDTVGPWENGLRWRKHSGGTVWDTRFWNSIEQRELSQTFTGRGAKRDAQNWLANKRTAKNRGEEIDSRRGKLSFAAIATEWLQSSDESDKRKRSTETDRYNLVSTGVRFTTDCEIARIDARSFSAQPIGRITQAKVQRLVNRWSTTRKPSTVRRMYSTLRAVFSYAVSDKVIPKSPCREIRLPEVPLVDRPVLIANDEDPDAVPVGQWTVSNADLERLADKLGPDYALMMWIAVALGPRWGEVAGLTVGAVNHFRGEISVISSLDRDRQLAPPKTAAGERTIPDRYLVDEIAAHLKRKELTGADPDALLFVNTKGGPLSYSPWRRRVWLRAVHAAGLDGLRFHDLRSVNASIMVAEDVDAKTAQVRFGHAHISTTLGIYARAVPKNNRAATEKIHAVLRRSRHDAKSAQSDH